MTSGLVGAASRSYRLVLGCVPLLALIAGCGQERAGTAAIAAASERGTV